MTRPSDTACLTCNGPLQLDMAASDALVCLSCGDEWYIDEPDLADTPWDYQTEDNTGMGCRCSAVPKPQRRRNWVVLQRNGNRSAFNGYRWQWSAYSACRCTRCGAVWRTKAAYVRDLPDAREDQRETARRELTRARAAREAR